MNLSLAFEMVLAITVSRVRHIFGQNILAKVLWVFRVRCTDFLLNFTGNLRRIGHRNFELS